MLALVLLIVALGSHVLPHPWWNFTAVGGSLLVWGARNGLRTAVVPVGLFALSDWYLTRFVYGYAFHTTDYLITWAWYALVVGLGFLLLRGRPGVVHVVVAAVLAPSIFFVASNYVVWAAPSSWYPHTLAGLDACYVAALPFYRNDLLSTGFVAGLVWGVPAIARRTRTHPEAAAGHI